MRKTLVSMALFVITLLSLAACSQSGGVNNFSIKRGTNLSHWLSQSRVTGEERRKHIQEDDFARLEQLGFDFVRIPIDEVQFWDEDGNKLPEAWELLTNAINLAEKHHLRVVVDLHIIRSHRFLDNDNSNTLFTSEKSQQDLINLWYQLYDVLKGYSNDSVAYEFMNEPVAPEHEQWNVVVEKVHKALRQVEPQRTLVVGSNRWQDFETVKYLRLPEGDKNLIISFHYYHPMVITHRYARWTPVGQFKGKINYPGVLITQEDYDAAPEAIKEELKPFLTTVWNKDKIRADFKDAIAAAQKYGLQLFCGEWGVYEPVERDLAYKWYKDMIDVFDEFDIAWTTWCYDGDFGFWDQRTESYKDKPLVDLLMSGKALGE
ncbi:MAG: cellulase family glycosylhydrolase [Bacteroidaceae bacterium]|nr:cellulase family glycosylhydrolase [Bacteroidaceae bacterium]MBQ9884956.1 cellulase family glycosylhydrolase [Bacteroidaceae bacterium]